MAEVINSFPDFDDAFGDKRIEQRAQQALNKLVLGRHSSIRQVSESRSQQKAFYRLLENEKFSEQNIERSIVKRCGELCEGRHVLCIQDTSEFNLQSHKSRLKPGTGTGRTTKEGIEGFFLHASFVVDAEKSTALGYSYIDAWHREIEAPNRHTREYKKLPIEEKESFKWIEAAAQSKKQLVSARQITVVADREADIYDLFGRYAGSNIKLLIRSNANRQINDGSEKVIEHLAAQPVNGTYNIVVNGDIRKGIEGRTAQLELKWSNIDLRKPHSCKNGSLQNKVNVTVLEAREKGKKGGICWRLYTTHPISNRSQALKVIEWYKQRWYIEQVFRLLKMQGFQIESSQLETGWAIRKLTMLALLAALRIMQMLIAYEDDNEQPLEEVFAEGEHQCLKILNEKLEGDTRKLSNPHKTGTLKWATWVIARLGGWKGYSTERKPGPIVLHRGFIKFYQLYEGWTLAQSFFKDVGTP